MGFQHRISGIPMYNWYIKRNHNLVGISWEYQNQFGILVTFFVCLKPWVNTPSHGRNISSEYIMIKHQRYYR